MNKKIENHMLIIAYIILASGFLLSFLHSLMNPWKPAFLCLALISSFTVKELIINLRDEKTKTYYAMILLDIVIIFALGRLSPGNSYKLFYFVLMYQCIFNNSLLFASIIFTLCCSENVIIIFYQLNSPVYRIPFDYIFSDLITFGTVFAILNLIKHISIINGDLDQAKNTLSIKNLELTYAYDNLKEAYERNEIYVMVEERNRLAREIHDTVGHTLTTALVEMEACSTLLSTDADNASQKLNLATEQVRKGLREMRNSVRTLSRHRYIYYGKEIIELIENAIKHSGISVRYDIDDFEKEAERIKKCIYRSLQEGLTNGIRHGKSTAFVFKLKYTGDNLLSFSLMDNGSGCSQIQKGFGLKAMEERVKTSGGTLLLASEPGEGFNIHIDFIVEGN